MSLVFAYGSNLSQKQMLSRCPSARAITIAHLPEATLAFAGHSPRWNGPVATYVRHPKRRLPGVVYKINPFDLFRLDAHEGTPHVYERIPVIVISAETARKVEVFVYRLVRGAGARGGMPSVDYILTLYHAYRDLGFAQRSLLQAALEPRRIVPLGHSCHR